MAKFTPPTLDEIWQSFADCVSDLEGWASSSSEGFTKEEKKRLREYDRMLDRILKAATKERRRASKSEPAPSP